MTSEEVRQPELIEVCPLDESCSWEAPVSGHDEVRDLSRVYDHLKAVHPEVVEPDPVRAGRLYKRDLWVRYRSAT